MSKQVTLSFELDDIYGLWHSSTRSFYFDQTNRFESIKELPATFKEDEGNYLYWLDGYANALLFTKVLNAFGYSTAVLSDAASETASWVLEVNEFVVLTDFAGNWK
jgi:hypothetical protein